MKPLRLLVFLEATTVTGPAKNLLQFATLARAQGVETLIAVFRRAGDSQVFKTAAENLGVPVEWIEESGRFDKSVLPAMTGLGQRWKPDVVQTHAIKGHFLARRAGLPTIAPWVAFHHGYTWTDVKMRLYNQLDRWSLRKARRVVTVSQPFAAEVERNGVDRRRVMVIHNAIDSQWGQGREASAALRAQWNIPATAPVVLLVGRFSREKDHLGLLQAVTALTRSEFPELRLVLVGDGPDRSMVEAKAVELGISKQVIFAGQVPTAEPFYGIANLAVLNSRTEGSPNALLEAMAAGVPVVATPVGGIPEIVRHRESAMLTPAGDPAGLATSMSEVLRSPELGAQLVSRAHQLIEERYTPATRVARLVELYRTVGRETGPR